MRCVSEAALPTTDRLSVRHPPTRRSDSTRQVRDFLQREAARARHGPKPRTMFKVCDSKRHRPRNLCHTVWRWPDGIFIFLANNGENVLSEFISYLFAILVVSPLQAEVSERLQGVPSAEIVQTARACIATEAPELVQRAREDWRWAPANAIGVGVGMVDPVTLLTGQISDRDRLVQVLSGMAAARKHNFIAHSPRRDFPPALLMWVKADPPLAISAIA